MRSSFAGRCATLAIKPSYHDLACDCSNVEVPLSGSVMVQGTLFPGQLISGEVELVLRRT